VLISGDASIIGADPVAGHLRLAAGFFVWVWRLESLPLDHIIPFKHKKISRDCQMEYIFASADRLKW
jgi:hypothetical protein